jgi:hypothetical protein
MKKVWYGCSLDFPLFYPFRESPASPSPYPEQFFWEKKGNTFPPPPHPRHLADGLPDHLVRGGLMDWYLDIGTVPVSSVRYWIVIG